MRQPQIISPNWRDMCVCVEFLFLFFFYSLICWPIRQYILAKFEIFKKENNKKKTKLQKQIFLCLYGYFCDLKCFYILPTTCAYM